MKYVNMSFDLESSFHAMAESEREVHKIPASVDISHYYVDDDRHIILEFNHRAENPLLISLADKKVVRRKLAAACRKSIPQIEQIEDFDRPCAGKTRYGCCYYYTLDGRRYWAAAMPILEKGVYYNITCSTREENVSVADEVFTRLLDSVGL